MYYGVIYISHVSVSIAVMMTKTQRIGVTVIRYIHCTSTKRCEILVAIHVVMTSCHLTGTFTRN